MTVRWKPLLVLSGLFLVIAVVGLLAMAVALAPRGAADFLAKARAERSSKQFDRAKIHYQNAIQADAKDPAVHEEMAAFYADWAATLPRDKAEPIRTLRLGSLAEAAKRGKRLVGPRRLLLAEAIALDEPTEAIRWAREVLAIDPKDAQAHHALAVEGLDDTPPDLPEVRKHLAVVDVDNPPKPRVAWIKAQVAHLAHEDAPREAVLAGFRDRAPAERADQVDRMAAVTLRALDIRTCPGFDPEILATRVRAFDAEAEALAADANLAPTRLTRLGRILEQAQKGLLEAAEHSDRPDARKTAAALGDEIEKVAETIYQKAIGSGEAEPALVLTYADHLRFRRKRDQCLKVVDDALKSPMAARANAAEAMMGLRAVAIEASLGDPADAARFDRASPHIKELIAGPFPKYQGLGHLFQGAIDLERSGIDADPDGGSRDDPARANRAKLRTSAMSHLKEAVGLLPQLAEAKARYGVALILAQDQALGRQYLQDALRSGELDAQYQIWAAWSIVQAGYPEEAEPIVARLMAEVERGKLPRELAGTLHLLSGEIHQARRTPADLARALAEYDAAIKAGQAVTPAVRLRLAQIDVMLNRPKQALARIDKMNADGVGGPMAEHLAVLTLRDQPGQEAPAKARLERARTQFPKNAELAALDAAIRVKAGHPDQADKLLADFLAAEPENLPILQMRAQVLAEALDKPAEARALLVAVADRAENSAPLVQLVTLDIARRDFDGAADSIAKVRRRWKEAASADLLDAQLALAKGDMASAAGHFGAALKKDPGNKVARFWKAQLDSRLGSSEEAAKSLESLVQARPTKELDNGLSLLTAAEASLANLDLANGDLDKAIGRYDSLLKAKVDAGGAGSLSRSLRWQRIAAFSASNRWADARAEIEALIGDPKSPPSPDERVQAADYFRSHKEEAQAQQQLDLVLKERPAHPNAVIARATMLHTAKKPAEAMAVLRKAIDVTKAEAPAVFYLMLAALENLTPPAAEGSARALATLDRGLEAKPQAIELVRAKYQVLMLRNEDDKALAGVEAGAKANPRGQSRRLLADVHRERGDLGAAERIVREIRVDEPDDARLAASLVRLVAAQARSAAGQGDREAERKANDREAGLIKEFRAKFPREVAFLDADCDLASRKGDLARAAAITQEIDALSKNSTTGPLLRAKLYSAQGRFREVADAYGEALSRNPKQDEVRVALAETRLKLGETDEALRQAKFVLDNNRDRVDATLVQARALTSAQGSPTQVASARDQAARSLAEAVAKRPKTPELRHALADTLMAQGKRVEAIAALKAGLIAQPADSTGLAMLVETLCSATGKGKAAPAADLADARALADRFGKVDAKGNACLALAVGFHKARQFADALPWAEKASALLDQPAVHLNHGDLLLSMADASADKDEARAYFERSLAQYDLVLKANANSVEAINNKAWIMHAHLGQGRAALELANALVKRVDPATLPGEFFDTLGAIQLGLKQTKEAEESFAKGLRKTPDHPMLNYHMGQIYAADRDRVGKAAPYLEKAQARVDALPPAMAADVVALLRKVGK